MTSEIEPTVNDVKNDFLSTLYRQKFADIAQKFKQTKNMLTNRGFIEVLKNSIDIQDSTAVSKARGYIISTIMNTVTELLYEAFQNKLNIKIALADARIFLNMLLEDNRLKDILNVPDIFWSNISNVDDFDNDNGIFESGIRTLFQNADLSASVRQAIKDSSCCC